MCQGNTCTGNPACPMMQLPHALPRDESCGRPPAEVFPNTMEMLRRHGAFFPSTNRAIGGKLVEEATT